MLKIDERSLALTAHALTILNPGRASIDHIRGHIMANINPGDNTVLSTGGWVASTYTTDFDDITYVRVTIEPYTALVGIGISTDAISAIPYPD